MKPDPSMSEGMAEAMGTHDGARLARRGVRYWDREAADVRVAFYTAVDEWDDRSMEIRLSGPYVCGMRAAYRRFNPDLLRCKVVEEVAS